MQKHFLKFRKVFTNIACSPLILISNNAELSAKYMPNDNQKSITTLEINNLNNSLFKRIDFKKEKASSFDFSLGVTDIKRCRTFTLVGIEGRLSLYVL